MNMHRKMGSRRGSLAPSDPPDDIAMPVRCSEPEASAKEHEGQVVLIFFHEIG
jgi:hypothetical protein